MKVIVYLAILGFSMAAWSADDVDMVRVPTADAGDQFVPFSKSTKRPLPANDDKVEILGANVIFLPMPTEATKVHVQWGYAVRFKGDAKPVSILVEDETRAPRKVAYQSDTLKLHDGLWAGIEPPKPVSKQLIAFLQSGQPLFRILRFTIKYQDGSTSKLYQASLHDSATLQAEFMKAANKVPH